MFKKINFIIFCLFLIFSMSCVCAQDNITITDEILMESDDSTHILDNSFKELDKIINSNSNESEIKLDNDYFYTQDDYFQDVIVINRSVTVDGQGHTIDAKMQSRIFTITAKNVTLKNIRFINGFIADMGGALYFSNNSSGMIINSTFINNSAWHAGAIAYDEYSEGTIINSTFINNEASYGGAIFQNSNSKTIILNSLFKDNFASINFSDDQGGAIVYGVNSTGLINNSRFINNSATLNGGAIVFRDYSNAIITNSFFTNNFAKNTGGALYHMGRCNSSISNSVFVSNHAKNGGAVYYSWKSSNIINSTFINNTAKESGGAVYYYFGSKNTIYNSEFSKNSAKNGGVVFYRDRTKGLINNSVFTENSAECGGAVYYLNQSAKSIINNSVFIRNFAKSASAYNAGKIYNCTVVKITPKLSSNKVNSFYNDNKYLTVTLKDHNNRPIKDASVNIQLNGNSKTFKTNSNGQVRLSVKALQPGSYNAVISFSGDDNFEGSKIISNIHIKKANTKILAKKKTFKAKKKNKKYTIVLKGVSSKFNVQLKIKGKKYNAVTKANGKAIFKLKLNKKGKYKATIKFKGDKNYKSSTKKVTIKIK